MKITNEQKIAEIKKELKNMHEYDLANIYKTVLEKKISSELCSYGNNLVDGVFNLNISFAENKKRFAKYLKLNGLTKSEFDFIYKYEWYIRSYNGLNLTFKLERVGYTEIMSLIDLLVYVLDLDSSKINTNEIVKKYYQKGSSTFDLKVLATKHIIPEISEDVAIRIYGSGKIDFLGLTNPQQEKFRKSIKLLYKVKDLMYNNWSEKLLN